MGQLEDLRRFIQIAEHGSIGKAAEQAGVAKSAMSRKLRLLEDRMQTALITRTTRQWSLTEAGREYYERGQALVTAFDEFEAGVRHENRSLSGDIRLSVPLYFGRTNLTPHLLAFAKAHPGVSLNVDFSDRLVDVIKDHYDLVVRISDLEDSSLIARRLCETRHLCCASPAYLREQAPIVQPEDLRAHRIIQYGSTKRPKWHFLSPTHKRITVSLQATMNAHDGEFLVGAAEDAQGIVRVPDFLAQASIDAGRLIELLPEYKDKPRGVHIVYPGSRYLPHRTRILMEFLIDKVRNNARP